MSNKDVKINDEANHRQSIGSFKKTPESTNRILEFLTDFLTGFGALLFIGIIFFIIIPLILITLKVGVVLAVPIAVFGAAIIVIALFGKLIRFLIKRKGGSSDEPPKEGGEMKKGYK